jgi:hypothetical protein
VTKEGKWRKRTDEEMDEFLFYVDDAVKSCLRVCEELERNLH